MRARIKQTAISASLLARWMLPLLMAAPAGGQVLITSGHLDLKFDWVGTGWQFGYELDFVEDLALNQARVVVGSAAQATRPEPAVWDFTGAAAGQSLFILPQSENPGLPWLGLATEGTVPGLIAMQTPDDPRLGGASGRFLTLQLIDLTFNGIGDPSNAQVSSWTTGPGGDPTVWISTAVGGIDPSDRFFLQAGDHAHYNWAFTQPGTYTLSWVASTILADSVVALSEPVEMTFDVIPEPGVVALLALGLVGFAVYRRRP